MSESKPIEVLVKDGTSYVRLPGRYGDTAYLINDRKADVAPGHSDWRIVEGDVTSIVCVTPQSSKLVGWKLRADCAGIKGHPATRPAEDFDRWEEHESEHARYFYEEVMEDQEPTRTDVPFCVVGMGVEPIKMPAYVLIDFPANLTHKAEVQHTFPCHVPHSAVFALLADRIVTLLAGNSEFRVNDYRSIQSLSVERRIKIPLNLRKPEMQEYYPRLTSRKSKQHQVVRTQVWHRLLNVVGTYRRESSDTIRTETIKGENWPDLAQRLEEYIQGFLGMFNKDCLETCGACKGAGVVVIQPPA